MQRQHEYDEELIDKHHVVVGMKLLVVVWDFIIVCEFSADI